MLGNGHLIASSLLSHGCYVWLREKILLYSIYSLCYDYCFFHCIKMKRGKFGVSEHGIVSKVILTAHRKHFSS